MIDDLIAALGRAVAADDVRVALIASGVPRRAQRRALPRRMRAPVSVRPRRPAYSFTLYLGTLKAAQRASDSTTREWDGIVSMVGAWSHWRMPDSSLELNVALGMPRPGEHRR